jgi:hypothetical protein
MVGASASAVAAFATLDDAAAMRPQNIMTAAVFARVDGKILAGLCIRVLLDGRC